MAKVNFKRIKNTSEIEKIPIEDGNFIVTGDGNAYIDYDDKRYGIGGTPDSEMSYSSTHPVQNQAITKYMDKKPKYIELLSISSIEPRECQEGDLYYNPADNQIHISIGENEWGPTTRYPETNIFYIDKNTNIIYRYNGITLVSDKYDLITDGPAVKTGRKIDGKDEWVVKKSFDNVSKGANEKLQMNIPSNAILHDFDIYIAHPDQKSVFVKKGWFIGSLANSFTAHGYKNGDIQVATGSESNWIISGMKYYVTVYYTLSNEVLNESNS